MMFTPMHNFLIPCKIGDWELKQFTLDEDDVKSAKLHSLFSFTHSEYHSLKPGTYMKLVHGGEVVMSDTPMEQETNVEVIKNAKGAVLIAGLGIGMVLIPLFNKPEVTSITVIELNEEVIGMINPQLPATDKAFRILHADISKDIPAIDRAEFDTIYFDIWSTVSADNYAEMKDLIEVWQPKLREDGWIGAWRYQKCIQMEFVCKECWESGDCQYCGGGGECSDCDGDEEYCEDCDNCGGGGECPECCGSGYCQDCDGYGYDYIAAAEDSLLPLKEGEY